MRAIARGVSTACPPLKEKPHSTMRSGSTPSSVRAKATAERQSSQLVALAKALARLAAGVAEVAVVEHEHRDARLGQALGVCGEPVVAREREAVRHHHARRGRARVCASAACTATPRSARRPTGM